MTPSAPTTDNRPSQLENADLPIVLTVVPLMRHHYVAPVLLSAILFYSNINVSDQSLSRYIVRRPYKPSTLAVRFSPVAASSPFGGTSPHADMNGDVVGDPMRDGGACSTIPCHNPTPQAHRIQHPKRDAFMHWVVLSVGDAEVPMQCGRRFMSQLCI